jgi:PTS system nitrogen regulatory IIA component
VHVFTDRIRVAFWTTRHAVKIIDFLPPTSVIADLSSANAASVLTELCAPIAKATGMEAQALVQALLAREQLGSTGVGEGLAIPHARMEGIGALAASFGRSRPGIDFQAIDGKPTTFFFVLFAPPGAHGGHLNALARISRLFKAAPFRESLLNSKNAAEIYQLIATEDAK